ncbi:MAG TPA: hypothetical protein VHW02_14025 [Rhizomicrobium sp.]|jgi:hypothetical protein|nr:hypothetical protein [Rhizomicrobium sp.]
MRKIPLGAFIALLACLSLSPVMAAGGADTLTRSEIAKLSPSQLSARVLSMIAKQGIGSEIRTYISPMAPTPPWLYRAAIDMPPVYDKSFELCHSERLYVDFAPLDPTAQSHMWEEKYDPPVAVSQIDMAHQYADPGHKDATDADCAALPKSSYFGATDISTAAQAMDMFKTFRTEAVKDKSATTFLCEDFPKTDACTKGQETVRAISSFGYVISIQEERHADASISRTIILAVGTPDSTSKQELWLTYRFAKTNGLQKADLKVLWPDPIP